MSQPAADTTIDNILGVERVMGNIADVTRALTLRVRELFPVKTILGSNNTNFVACRELHIVPEGPYGTVDVRYFGFTRDLIIFVDEGEVPQGFAKMLHREYAAAFPGISVTVHTRKKPHNPMERLYAEMPQNRT